MIKVGDLVKFVYPVITVNNVEVLKTDKMNIGVILRIGTYKIGNDNTAGTPNYPEGDPLYEILWLTERPEKAGFTFSGYPPDNISYEIPESIEVIEVEK